MGGQGIGKGDKKKAFSSQAYKHHILSHDIGGPSAFHADLFVSHKGANLFIPQQKKGKK